MTAKIHPYPQHPRYKVNVVSSSFEDVLSNNDTIKQSDNNLIPSSSLKSNISLWPTVFWIGLGTLIFISLVLVVVAPIVALANASNSTTSSTICPTTSITTTITLSSLPEQCDSYTIIADDDTRSPDYTGPTFCDATIFNSTPEWVRFTGSGGTILASCPINISSCGADAPGWYSGIYPSSAGTIGSGYVCFNYLSNDCYWTNFILVTNCNGFYVFYLTAPPACNLRYCTI